MPMQRAARGSRNLGRGTSAIAGSGEEPRNAIDSVRGGGLRAVSKSAADAAEAAQHREDDAAAVRRSNSHRGISGEVSPGSGDDLSAAEGEARVKRAGDLLRMVHAMAPADPSDFNRALIIWYATTADAWYSLVVR